VKSIGWSTTSASHAPPAASSITQPALIRPVRRRLGRWAWP